LSIFGAGAAQKHTGAGAAKIWVWSRSRRILMVEPEPLQNSFLEPEPQKRAGSATLIATVYFPSSILFIIVSFQRIEDWHWNIALVLFSPTVVSTQLNKPENSCSLDGKTTFERLKSWLSVLPVLKLFHKLKRVNKEPNKKIWIM